jgi:hypothetical protein
VTVRLNGSLTAQVLSDGAGWTLVVHDIRSARTLRHLSRAIGSWHAFGRYDRVLLDLSALLGCLTGPPRRPHRRRPEGSRGASTSSPWARWTVRRAAPASRRDGRFATPW